MEPRTAFLGCDFMFLSIYKWILYFFHQTIFCSTFSLFSLSDIQFSLNYSQIIVHSMGLFSFLLVYQIFFIMLYPITSLLLQHLKDILSRGLCHSVLLLSVVLVTYDFHRKLMCNFQFYLQKYMNHDLHNWLLQFAKSIWHGYYTNLWQYCN